jgi:CSLREA domain-containing protein
MKERSLGTLSIGDVAVRTVALPARIEGPAENRKKILATWVLVAMVALSLLLITAGPAHAVTLTVNNTVDPGDGDCDPNGGCTLREAMNEANHTTADTIKFNIPGSGVKTISPTSRLPTTTERLTIDGYSQPGAKANTLTTGTNAVLKIELDGSDIGASSSALSIRTSDSVVKGLVINRFGSNGIRIGTLGVGSCQDNRIAGNFIGTNPSGTMDLGQRQQRCVHNRWGHLRQHNRRQQTRRAQSDLWQPGGRRRDRCQCGRQCSHGQPHRHQEGRKGRSGSSANPSWHNHACYFRNMVFLSGGKGRGRASNPGGSW